MNNNWMIPTQSGLFSALETNITSSQNKQLREIHRKGTQPKYKPSYRHWDETPLEWEAYLSLVDRGDFD